MQITLERKVKTDTSTIGRLFVDNLFECFTLEDKDRGLAKDWPLVTIQKMKVFAKTAIPAGTYEVILSYSDRFKRPLPLLLNVPGYAGVRIHSGNCPEDTEGCILPGTSQGTNWIYQSRDAFAKLLAKIEAAAKTEKIYLTIK